MRELKGNLFDQQADAICITTNGFVRKNGSAVMGKGCAEEAVRRYPRIDFKLGAKLTLEGNKVHRLMRETHPPYRDIVSFPVKPNWRSYEPGIPVRHMAGKFGPGDLVPGWACKADLQIITRSAHQLVELADVNKWESVILPRPGCGAGELDWHHVGHHLREILDDRFACITF